MLNEKQLECIDYLIQGTHTNAQISKLLQVSDRVIYKWKKNEEFKAELKERTDKYLSDLTVQSKNRMVTKLGMALENIIELANNSSSEKIKLEANQWIYEMVAGKATSKVQDVTEQEKKDEEFNLDELDNIIELNTKKAN